MRQKEDNKNGLFEKFLNMFGFEAEEVYEQNETAASYEEPLRREPKDRERERGKLLSLTNTVNNKLVKMVVVEPDGFDEVQTIVDHLKNKQTVILNLEETDKVVARRIADFLGGAIYALEGTMQKVSGSIFLFTPANIEVAMPLRTELKNRESDKDPERSTLPPSLSAALFRNDRDR